MAFPRSDVVADATPAQQVPGDESMSSRPTAPITVKIVVAGGFAVGKTTFIGSISDIEPLSTEAAMTEHSVGVDDAGGVSDRKTSTTVAMDFGRISLPGNLWLYLFGTPGQDRFLFMWDDLVKGAIGAVVLVDTDRLDQCFPAVDYFEARQIPFVVAVNCFDGVARHQLEDVREALAVPAHVPMLYTDARTRAVVASLALEAKLMARWQTGDRVKARPLVDVEEIQAYGRLPQRRFTAPRSACIDLLPAQHVGTARLMKADRIGHHPSLAAARQRCIGQQEILDRAAADKMLDQDALEVLGRAVPVPRAVGVDERNRPGGADAQAVDLGAQDAARVLETELLDATLEVVPTFERLLRRRAVAADAQKDVTGVGAELELVDGGGDCVLHWRRTPERSTDAKDIAVRAIHNRCAGSRGASRAA